MSSPRYRFALILSSQDSYARGLMLGIGQWLRHYPHCLVRRFPQQFTKPADLLEWKADGIIHPFYNESAYRKYAAIGIPMIDVDFSCKGYPIARVAVDLAKVGQMAGTFFKEHSFRHVIFATPDWAHDREAVAQSLAEHCGCDSETMVIPHALEWDAAIRSQITAELHRRPKPCAILAHHDRLAYTLSILIRESGMIIPDEIALLGEGNDPDWCHLAYPALSSIEIPTIAIGARAADRLLTIIESGQEDTTAEFLPPVALWRRRSTEIMVSKHPEVERALRFMRDHCHEGIGAQEVIGHCPGSKSRLQRHFKTETGQTLLEYLTQLRISRACDLLRMTKLSAKEIADRCGYPSAQNFNLRFKTAMGLSPLQWRAKK